MPFTTVDFIAFFTVVFFGYYALPHRFRWMLLLAGSWVFYGWVSPLYLIFLAFATVVTYASAVGMGRNYQIERTWLASRGRQIPKDEKKVYKNAMERKRFWMGCVSIVSLIGLLVAFKYLEFLLVNIAWLGGVVGFAWKAPVLNLILPVGLSFYVFQSMAYVIDVQRGEVEPERNFFRHALFVSYFPQIMQGPIGNYGRLSHQFYERHDFDYEQVVYGIQRVAWGFFKKLVVANRIAAYANPAWAQVDDYSGFCMWAFFSVSYAIQLYADFSGYMDIACGCSQMLGIKLDENFDCPYFSRSVSEYWRRWHISLSSWFRDYLFYPVLRSNWESALRKSFSNRYLSSVAPTAIALAVVWAATGLWHGASWGYVVWGCYYGVFMILGIALAPVYDRLHRAVPALVENRLYAVFQIVRTFAIVCVGYSIFKPANVETTLGVWKSSVSGLAWNSVVEFVVRDAKRFVFIGAGVAMMFVVDVIHFKLGYCVIRRKIRELPAIIRFGIYVFALFLIVFYGLYGSGFGEFEYFRF